MVHITGCFFLFASLSEAASLLQRSRQRSFAGLRYSPQDPAARTILTLDTNHDGRIDSSEIAAFARSQGLDASAATEEFSSIDSNSDGTLDSKELQQVLGSATAPEPTELTSQEVTVVQPNAPQTMPVSLQSAPTESAKPQVEVEAPLNAAPSAALEAEGGNNAQQTDILKIEQNFVQQQKEPVIESPVATSKIDHMDTELISEESRNSVRMAAKKVADELALEESEEIAARKLDRKAEEVRANSTALAKMTVQDALDAGAKAAHKKADELMKKITEIEEEAERAEVRAAALRAKSKMELEEGNQLMAAAEQALGQSPDHSN